MTMDGLDAYDVIRKYIIARARKESIPSLTGRLGEGPPSTCGPNGDWEVLLALTWRLTEFQKRVWSLKVLGSAGTTEELDELIEIEGKAPIVLTKERAEPLGPVEIGRLLNAPIDQIKVAMSESLRIVGESLAQRRALERDEKLMALRERLLWLR